MFNFALLLYDLRPFLTYLILQLSFCFAFAQSDAINSCVGAVNIFENDDYTLQFPGKRNETIQDNYPFLADKLNENQVWCSYVAPEDGELDFSASVKSGFLQMILFKEDRKDICEEIGSGVSEIERMMINDSLQTVGLSKNTGGGMMYSVELKKGDKIMIIFATEKKSVEKLNLHFTYSTFEALVVEQKIVDLRDDDFAPTLSIVLRDKETKQPIIGSITIMGSRDLEAMYIGSDFFFNVERRCKLEISCDAQGYFFKDIEVGIEAMEGKDVVLELDKVAKGKKILLEEIEFLAGKSEILPSSEARLKRLKDFLALNAEIEIEIQGHVHFDGDKNTLAAQKMSEARAKRVLQYLTDNGIDKRRLNAVGFGNTQPIYADAKLSYEEQANRRVEIVIK